eukprot:c5846_g1_i1.p1 GENE.c5846_g1_i1~~c5846_g1_i1.p1  ORF type:complete len:384 (-),score=68.17 c5846_g1_i1:443-1552(-)
MCPPTKLASFSLPHVTAKQPLQDLPSAQPDMPYLLTSTLKFIVGEAQLRCPKFCQPAQAPVITAEMENTMLSYLSDLEDRYLLSEESASSSPFEAEATFDVPSLDQPDQVSDDIFQTFDFGLEFDDFVGRPALDWTDPTQGAFAESVDSFSPLSEIETAPVVAPATPLPVNLDTNVPQVGQKRSREEMEETDKNPNKRQCSGLHQKSKQRCRNMALLLHRGVQSMHCAEHVHLESEPVYHKCGSLLLNEKRGRYKLCKETIVSEFPACHKHISEWVAKNCPCDASGLAQAISLRDAAFDYIAEMRRGMDAARALCADEYQRRCKMLPKCTRMVQILTKHVMVMQSVIDQQNNQARNCFAHQSQHGFPLQ